MHIPIFDDSNHNNNIGMGKRDRCSMNWERDNPRLFHILWRILLYYAAIGGKIYILNSFFVKMVLEKGERLTKTLFVLE